MDKTLKPADAGEIFEKLLPAWNKPLELGLVLNLPLSRVEAIHMQYLNPRDCVLRIIIAFLEQAEPRPTWRVIVEALRSRVVNLPDLARRVEAALIPDPTATRDVVLPETTTGKSPSAPIISDLFMSPPVLTLDDAETILDELFEAQNQSYMLGLALKLPFSEVEAIHGQYQNPRDRLLRVIIAFLEQAEPRPTWGVIVEALRSRAVNLPRLARRVEAAHCPDPTATRSGEFTTVLLSSYHYSHTYQPSSFLLAKKTTYPTRKLPNPSFLC